MNNKKTYLDFERNIDTVSWKEILLKENNPNIESFLRINGNVFVSELVGIIKSLYKKNKQIKSKYKDSGTSLEISVGIHANSNILIGFNESEFAEILDYCINFYETLEKYENCQKILKIKESIVGDSVINKEVSTSSEDADLKK